MVSHGAISGVAERLCGPDGPPVLRFDFEGAPLTAIRLRGRAAFLASEVGRALGYAGPSEVGELVTDEWRAEFSEGRDFDVVRGRDLRDLKDLVQLTGQHPVSQPAPIGARARACMLLYERGLDGVIMKTDKPAGVRMRAWLRDEVLPKLRRGEGVPAKAPAAPAGACEVPPAPVDSDESSEVAQRAVFRLMEIARAAGALDANGKLSMTDGADMNLPVRQAPPTPVTPAGLDPRDLEIAKLRAELAEARETIEHAKVVAMRTKARTDKRIAVLADAAADASVTRALAARNAEEARSVKEKAAAVAKHFQAMKNEIDAARADYQTLFQDYKLMGSIRLCEWWSPTRIASLIGEDVTAEEVGRVINQIPSLRRRGDVEGLCRSVPYSYRHGGALREGVRYEYSKAALGWILNTFHGLPLDGE